MFVEKQVCERKKHQTWIINGNESHEFLINNGKTPLFSLIKKGNK